MEKSNRLHINDIDKHEHLWIQGKKYYESICVKCGMVQNLRSSKFTLPDYGCKDTLGQKGESL